VLRHGAALAVTCAEREAGAAGREVLLKMAPPRLELAGLVGNVPATAKATWLWPGRGIASPG
jgi:hypothetical protein